MSATCFLMDENTPAALRRGLLRLNPEIQVFTVGHADAPPLSTLDPDILVWLEAQDCLLVTSNRASMPVHLRDHLDAGGHVPGILTLPKRFAIGEIVEQLYLIWLLLEPGEYRDQIVYLPL